MPRPHLLDELVRASAAPDSVRLVADQLFAAFPQAREQLESEPALAARFAAVAAASHSLSRVIVTDPAALDVLAHWTWPRPTWPRARTRCAGTPLKPLTSRTSCAESIFRFSRSPHMTSTA